MGMPRQWESDKEWLHWIMHLRRERGMFNPFFVDPKNFVMKRRLRWKHLELHDAACRVAECQWLREEDLDFAKMKHAQFTQRGIDVLAPRIVVARLKGAK